MMEKESQNSLTILVIDDDERIRTLLRDILLLGGYRVIEASDGTSGANYLEKGRFDMVMTDLGMPGMNGWQVAKLIKTKTPQVPVFLITGWGINLDKEKIDESGVDLIISKPFQVNEILEAVHLFNNNFKENFDS